MKIQNCERHPYSYQVKAYPVITGLGELDRTVNRNDVFRHFKGGLYMVRGISINTETGEAMVNYSPINDMNTTWSRPHDMFLSEVDREKYPDVEQEYRLVKVKLEVSIENN